MRCRFTMFVMLLVATAAAWAPTGLANEDTINVGLFGEPDFLDPHMAASVGVPLLENVYESLVFTYRDTNEIVPVLAERWDVSSDGLVYTFYLRKGVLFHDGTEMTAADVQTSFERIAEMKTGAYWVLSHLEDMRIIDDYTIEMRIRPGGPPFIQAISMVKIISADAIERHERNGDLARAWLNENSAGTGPYVIESWLRGDRVVLTKFDDYWQGWDGPHFSRANMLVIPEASTQQLMLERGELDIAMRFPVRAPEQLERNRNITVIREPGVRILSFRLNYQAGPTADPRVRKAMAHAFDYNGFARAMDNTFRAPESIIPLVFLGGEGPDYPYTHDVNKARTLLEEAGYSTRNRMHVHIDVLAGDQAQLLGAQILQAGLRRTGVAEATIRENEWAPMLDALVQWGETRDPETARNVFGLYTPPRFPDAYSYFWYMFHTDAQGGSGRNLMYYENETVDQLIDAAALSGDQAEQLQLYREAAELILADAPDIILGMQEKIYLVRSELKGFYVHPTWYPAVHIYGLSR